MPQKTEKLDKESSQNINDKSWQDGVSLSTDSGLTKETDKSPVNEKIPQLSEEEQLALNEKRNSPEFQTGLQNLLPKDDAAKKGDKNNSPEFQQGLQNLLPKDDAAKKGEKPESENLGTKIKDWLKNVFAKDKDKSKKGESPIQGKIKDAKGEKMNREFVVSQLTTILGKEAAEALVIRYEQGTKDISFTDLVARAEEEAFETAVQNSKQTKEEEDMGLAMKNSEDTAIADPLIRTLTRAAKALSGEVTNTILKLASQTGGSAAMGPIKGHYRIMDKIAAKAQEEADKGNKKDIFWSEMLPEVKDILRATIAYEDMDGLNKGAIEFKKALEGEKSKILKAQNIFTKPTDNGYRDVKIVYKKELSPDHTKAIEDAIKKEGEEGIVSMDFLTAEKGLGIELQFNLKDNIAIKEGKEYGYHDDKEGAEKEDFRKGKEHDFDVKKFVDSRFANVPWEDDAQGLYKELTDAIDNYKSKSEDGSTLLPNNHDIYQRESEKRATDADKEANKIYELLYELSFRKAGGKKDRAAAKIEGFK